MDIGYISGRTTDRDYRHVGRAVPVRLSRVKLGRPLGDLVEIATYLTQEEVSQMVMARRERSPLRSTRCGDAASRSIRRAAA